MTQIQGEQTMEKPKAVQKVLTVLETVMVPGFFGNLQLEFKNGELSLIRKTEAMLPEEGLKHGRSDYKANQH
jgi:hypothetical protein